MEGARRAVALYGGTFDPFHNGHLRMAIEVKESFGLPRLVLLPAGNPPHKPRQPLSEVSHRMEMARAAVAGLDGIEVSDAEIRREGPSYSLLTIREFALADPSADLLFVLGADAFTEIPTWHRYEELLAACDFVLLPRPGAAAEPPSPGALRIEKEASHCYSWKGCSYRLPGGRRLYCPELPALDISSRAIREKVRTGKCIRGLVPPEVELYIRRHGLYGVHEEERRP